MFKKVAESSFHQEWMKNARLLDPPYDYFNFADMAMKDNRTTNCLYLTLLNDALEKTVKKSKQPILDAIILFNRRGNKNSIFYSQYSEYWKVRRNEENEIEVEKNVRNIQKRTQEALQDITTNIVGSMVETTKKLRSQEANINNESSSHDTDKLSNTETETNIINQTTILFQQITGLKVLHLDDEGVIAIMDKKVLDKLKLQTTIDVIPLSAAATSLLEIINQAHLNFQVLRTIIRNYRLPENEVFDIVIHADLNFVETVGIHFLNLAQSPRNPLLFSTLERTAAIHTSIMLLNNLFLSVNDMIHFNWIEIETLLTQNTKWDGVGFCPTSKKNIGYCLIEFSGGIMKNCTKNKAVSDEKKIEKGTISFIEYTESRIGHFVRYHDMKLYFELIFFIEATYIRRTYATVILPTTPAEYKAFFNQTQQLFNWKNSLIDSMQNL